jgi:glycine/D-amino acid oxidase-like deaminating enzyme
MKIVVVGAGVAGVAAAELLQRYPGNRVTLIEAKSQIGTGASMDQHGWFHMGSLYSIQSLEESVTSAVKNVRILTRYYESYVNQEADEPGNRNRNTWFVDEPISYLFPGGWHLPYDVRQAAYSKELDGFLHFSQDIVSAGAALGQLLKFDRVWSGVKIVSSDLPMRTKKILDDLVCSFQTNGGEIRLSSKYLSHGSTAAGGVEVTLVDGATVHADVCVICSGEQLASCGWNAHGLVVRRSPIMVVTPALCNENIVVVEAKDHASFSHIVHSHRGQRYSVVSGAYSADVGDEEGSNRAAMLLKQVTRSHFPARFDASSHELYFGTKVDRLHREDRRDYSPTIVKLERNVIGAIPGKFSFAFLLAHNLALRVMSGKDIPSSTALSGRRDPAMVATPKHELVAAALLQARRSRQMDRDRPSYKLDEAASKLDDVRSAR